MTDLSRRHVLGLLGALSALGFAPARAEEAAGATLGPATPFDPEMIIARARALARAPSSCKSKNASPYSCSVMG